MTVTTCPSCGAKFDTSSTHLNCTYCGYYPAEWKMVHRTFAIHRTQ